MHSERELREDVCRIARDLYERGHNAPLDGNISARLSERTLLATPTSCHKGRLRSEQVVKVSALDGRPLDDRQRASTEIKMHVAIYKHRPDVGAIVHAHSPCTVGLTVAGISLERPVVPEVILTLGSVPTVPYASPTTTDVPDATTPHLAKCNAFLLERHGPVALGTTLDEAFHRLETIEHTAKITVAALSVGKAAPLPESEYDKLRAMALRAGALTSPADRAEAQEEILESLVSRVLAELRK